MPPGGPRTNCRQAAGTGTAQRRRRALLVALALLTAAAGLYVRPAGAAVPKPKIDLRTVKTAAPFEATPGGSLTYTVQIANVGPSGALAVVVEDALPPGATVQSAAITRGTCETTAATVSCDVGPMAAPDAVELTITAAVAPGAPGELTNCATVRNDEADPDAAPEDTDPGNDTSCVTTRVLPVVGKLVTRPPVAYGFVIANTAGEPVALDVAPLALPPGLAAAAGSGGQAGRVLVPGHSVTELPFVVNVVTGRPTTVVAAARATTAAGGVLFDGEPTRINGGSRPAGTAVMRLRSTSPFQAVTTGGAATVALELENVSAAASVAVSVAVTVPSGLTVVAGPTRWEVPALPPGGSAATELTIRADRAGRYEVVASGPGADRAVSTVAVADAFVVRAEPAAGRVFLDTDADGTPDPGEGGIEGIAVQLLDPAGTAVAAALTDGAGRYSLPAAPPGHRVEVLSAGFVTTTPKIRLARAGDVDFGLRPGTP